ncbi:undecaprenyl-diphosphatase [Tumebacillus sp. BK434]|uniref:phosphatase PAP2 family protein n=1 Tax=Tumebacillus sp. BK434 TaxID=2512169 RepID=UPI00104FE9D0|nr:phosphatase PAP2 family protein [Tumebacillus sp. BK434]TCP55591.1 undecaprenyl-diphosphatase [Tumebacillus sp. BK434]
MDKLMMQSIRRYVGRSRLLDRTMVHIAKYGPLWFFAVLGLLAIPGGRTERLAALLAVLAATVTRGVNELVGRICFRVRPFVREGFTPLLKHRPSASFPSNHAACGFALAAAVWLLMPLVGACMLLMAAVLAVSRVYVGLHYPSDVTFGAVLGTVIAILIEKAIFP